MEEKEGPLVHKWFVHKDVGSRHRRIGYIIEYYTIAGLHMVNMYDSSSHTVYPYKELCDIFRNYKEYKFFNSLSDAKDYVDSSFKSK